MCVRVFVCVLITVFAVILRNFKFKRLKKTPMK